MLISAAAPADTWGISGPTFLFLYLAAAGLLILAAVVQRSIVFAGRRELAANQLTPEQAAYLNGGERLAVYASLGGLRAAGSVGTTAQGRALTATGPMPAGATRLDRAVHNAAERRIRPRDLAGDQYVRAALHDIRRQLEHVGLAPTVEQRRAARLFPLLLLGLLAVGVARFIAGIIGDKPVLYLLVLLIGLAVTTLILLGSVPRHTRAARTAIKTLKGQHAHLSPSSQPSYHTYGATSAALGVALFGGAAFYALDPAFAAEAEVQRNLASGSTGGSSDGGSSGGGDGGGGGCGGGGGGCGGGGCGG